MTPQDRADLETDLKADEGFRVKAYQDSVGVWTIGYGTNLQELIVPASVALQWMLDTLAARESDCLRVFPWFATLSGARQAVLLNMAYNLGMPRLQGFTKMLAACAVGDYQRAADEMIDSKWATQVGARAQRLAQAMRNG